MQPLEETAAGIAGATEGMRHRPISDRTSESSPVDSPEAAAAEMIGRNAYQQAGKKVKLTWGDRKQYRDALGKAVPMDRRRGLRDGRLPGYMWPRLGWYIYNLKIIDAAGKERALEEVPEWIESHGRGKEQQGLIEKVPMRAIIRQSLADMRAAAIRENEMLCQFCCEHEAETVKEKAQHIRVEHPEEFDAWLGVAPEAQKSKQKKAG